jgi:hypothetical protein
MTDFISIPSWSPMFAANISRYFAEGIDAYNEKKFESRYEFIAIPKTKYMYPKEVICLTESMSKDGYKCRNM